MKQKNYLMKLALCAAVALTLSLVLKTEKAEASHFRFGHLTWQPVSGNTVQFNLIAAFRRSGYPGSAGDGRLAVGDNFTETVGATGLFFGDGNYTGTLNFKTISIDIANDWVLAQALQPGSLTKTSIDYTYPSPDNGGAPWIAQINSCCRTGAEQNNPDWTYQVLTEVELVSGNTSPSSSLPAIVNLPQSATATFTVPGADPDPNTELFFRLATGAESAFMLQPAGLTVSSTGVVTWNTLGAVLGGLYSCQIVIEDRDLQGMKRTQVAIDFLIRIVACDPANSAPVFDAPTPACGSVIPASENQPMSFTVAASDVNAGDDVILNSAGIPTGATLTPGLPSAGNPVSSVFEWTPGPGSAGAYVVTFSATDDCGAQALCSYTIEVSACNISVDAGPDEETFFGFAADQSVTRTAVPSGGTPPYSYTWSMSRPLLCNQINSTGDESFSGGTCVNNACPSSGSLLLDPSCASSNGTVTAKLMEDAEICVTVTDANGCSATDCFLIDAEDVRCFAGNSGNEKVTICHATGNDKKPWVQICIAQEAVDAHLTNNEGDYPGACGSRMMDNSFAGDFAMSVYPNPAADMINIEFNAEEVSIYKFELVDITGRTVFTQTGVTYEEGNRLSVPLNAEAGVYKVRLSVGGKTSFSNIMISK